MELAHVTVSDRENKRRHRGVVNKILIENMIWDESGSDSCFWSDLSLKEPAVLGEMELGNAILGNKSITDRLDATLRILSNNSFPERGNRSNLSKGYKRMLRDAMILETHIRHERDYLLTKAMEF